MTEPSPMVLHAWHEAIRMAVDAHAQEALSFPRGLALGPYSAAPGVVDTNRCDLA